MRVEPFAKTSLHTTMGRRIPPIPPYPAISRQSGRDVFLRSAPQNVPPRPPLERPHLWQSDAVSRQCAPVAASGRERPPEPARLFSVLRAAGFTAAPSPGAPAPMASDAVSCRRLPRSPANARQNRRDVLRCCCAPPGAPNVTWFLSLGQIGRFPAAKPLQNALRLSPFDAILPPLLTPASQRRARRGPLRGLALFIAVDPGFRCAPPGATICRAYGAGYVVPCLRCVLRQQPGEVSENQVALAGYAAAPAPGPSAPMAIGAVPRQPAVSCDLPRTPAKTGETVLYAVPSPGVSPAPLPGAAAPYGNRSSRGRFLNYPITQLPDLTIICLRRTASRIIGVCVGKSGSVGKDSSLLC
jgi:hypothetical protein